MNDQRIVEGVQLFPLQRFDDERGWFVELARASALTKRPLQANLSFSRQGVVRGLHYHERGQDDLFVCLRGMARVVVLDRGSDHAFSVDIGDANQVALYVPGHHAHGFEALADVLMLYLVTEEYNAEHPDEHVVPWDDPRVRHLWSTSSPTLSGRDASAAAS
jgi:dTDP-4-dehydrorhamnose 3,5-epimerase